MPSSDPDAAAVALRAAEPKLAYSLEHAQPDELIVADGRGRVVSRARLRRIQWGAWVVVGGLIAGAFWVGPLYGTAAAFGALIGGRVTSRGTPAVNRVLAQIKAGDLDGARASLDRLPRDNLAANLRPMTRILEGMIQARSGWGAEAATSFAAGVAEYERLSLHKRQLWYWLARFCLCGALARLHRFDDAERARPPADELPDGEMYALSQCYAGIQLAFHADDDAYLPDDHTVHDIGNVCLRSNVLGSSLVLIAWACDRRGDRDLAEHYLTEAQSRLNRTEFEQYEPQIARWMDQRLAGIGTDSL